MIRQIALVQLAHSVRPPEAMLTLHFTPRGMIVRPPTMLEAMLHTGIANRTRFGSDLRRKGSMWSTANAVDHGRREDSAAADVDVAVTEPFQRGATPLGQRGNQLDRVHVADEFPQDGGLVAAPADLDHPLIGLRFDRFRHECHDVRLGVGLIPANRQRPVLMGRVRIRIGGKLAPRHPFQGAQHAVVCDPLSGDLLT